MLFQVVDGSDTEWNWSMEGDAPTIQPFDDFIAGFTTTNLSANSTELQFFEYFADETLMKEIARCTNRYFQYYVRNVDIRQHSRTQDWSDVNSQHIYLFLAVTMLMTRNKRISIEEHWSTDPLLNSPIFHNILSRNKYCLITSMLHFTDVFTSNERLPRLHKLQFLIDHARNKFKEAIIPHQKICIDESIVPFKGRLILKQYLPKKRNRFGIKLFVLCDVKTGFIIDFIVYSGKETDMEIKPELGVSGSVVTALMENYLNSNRTLYVDNWYSSPTLFKHLMEKGTYACGTVKKSRIGMPKFKKLKKGEMEAFYSPPLMALKWVDKKAVTMISTKHGSNIIPTDKEDRATGLPKLKPECVDDYTKNMGSIDTADMLISTLTCIKKSRRWYKKLALRIIDMHLLNAFYAFKEIKGCRNKPFSEFQLEVIRQLIEKYKLLDYQPVPSTSRGVQDNPSRFLPRDALKHFPTRIPNNKSQRCRVCALKKKRTETRFMCKECNVFLCIEPCSAKFHSNK